MSRAGRLACGLVLLALAAAAAGVGLIVVRGVSARDEPTFVEAFVARRLRSLAIPRAMRVRQNPEPPTPEVLSSARAHFADHCASCHGNDGKGQTTLGRNMYPKAPDMTLPDTQRLSDGELFAIVENGVRLTGMPAWGSPGPEDDAETWELVHFIRHLPKMTPEELDEMKEMNAKTREGTRRGRGDPPLPRWRGVAARHRRPRALTAPPPWRWSCPLEEGSMKKVLAVLVAAATLAVPGGLLAHEGHVHKVMGTVAVIDASHVEVDTKDGKKESYPLTKDTKYLRGKAPAAIGDAKVGTRVVLSLVEKDGKKSVTEVLMAETQHPHDKHQQ